MMHGRGTSDSAVVALKPTNKAEPSAAEPVEPRAEAKGKVGQQSTHRAQDRIWRVTGAGTPTASGVAVTPRGKRSYGAGGGGRGTFIVHTN